VSKKIGLSRLVAIQLMVQSVASVYVLWSLHTLVPKNV
jgi:hypothetical protein